MLPIQDDLKPTLIYVFPSSQLFSICGLLQLALIYAKISVQLYFSWKYAFIPIILFFLLKLFESLYSIQQVANHRTDEHPNLLQLKYQAIWSITSLLISGSLAVAFLHLGDLIDKEVHFRNTGQKIDLEDPIKHLFCTFAFALLVYLVYSVSVQSRDTQNLGASQIFVNFVLSSLGNTVSFCSGGACNSFYISTLSSFFSAFGIPIAQYIHYLNFLCLFLLLFSLISLYSVKYTWRYAPFLISLVGTLCILCDMFVYDWNVLTYGGNVLIIGAALWNSKINKFRFGSRRTKRK